MCVGVGTGAVEEAFVKRGMKFTRGKTEYTCLNGTPFCNLPICPTATGDRFQISGKHHAERWRHECRSEQEDTVWMEQLEEDAGGPKRLPPHGTGKIDTI